MGARPSARATRTITPALIARAARDLRSTLSLIAARAPTPRHPPPGACALLVELASHGGSVTFVRRERN